MKHKRKEVGIIGLGLISAGLAMAQSSLATAEADGMHGRGRLIRAEFIGRASREQVAQGLAGTGWSDVTVKSGITISRLIYTTVDAHGAPTIASGLMALPTDIEPVGVVSFEHGTSAQKSNVPSLPGSGEGQAISALFASGGFALIAPDYIGLGLSPGPHPYLHARTEASASVDLLTASRLAACEARVKLPARLYITGFSQGGQAALALERAIESDSDSPWSVVAIASIAGPYDLSGTEFPRLLDGVSPSSSAYLAYLALSYIQVYGTGNTAAVFASPYDLQVTSLFDGQHSLEQIAQALPPPRALFRPEFLAAVSDASSPFLWQMRENDTVLITPRAPVRLYYGEADIDVLPENAQVAELAMGSLRVQVSALDLGAHADHPASADIGLRAVRTWFDELARHR